MTPPRKLTLPLTVLTLAVCGLLPSTAAAHPLGNFTTNQLVQVKVSSDSASLHYVLDQAEIPTFQQIGRFDTDGDGTIAGTEQAPFEQELLTEVEAKLGVSADGKPVPLGLPANIELSFPPGQAGLALTRLEATFPVALANGLKSLSIDNKAFDDRLGWREIQAVPGDGTAVVSDLPVSDPTDELRAYPVDLLSSPFDQREVTLEVSSGSGTVNGPDGPTVSADADTGRATDGFADILTGARTDGALILLLLLAAFGWGALHALSPGHGKAMVAGYLAGSRGKPRHAAALGLTVTATHVVSVFALGLVTLAASQYIVPEKLYPWLGIASGVMIVVIGLRVMLTRFQRWRSVRRGEEPAHDHSHGHSHDHGHSHSHSHSHDHTHDSETPIRTRELIGLGVSGGIVPCPSALVVLIAAISQHRLGLGIVLIFAFSLGLAATITGIGLVTIWGRKLMGRLNPEKMIFGGRISGAIPTISASVIVLAGVLITTRAVPQLT